MQSRSVGADDKAGVMLMTDRRGEITLISVCFFPLPSRQLAEGSGLARAVGGLGEPGHLTSVYSFTASEVQLQSKNQRSDGRRAEIWGREGRFTFFRKQILNQR